MLLICQNIVLVSTALAILITQTNLTTLTDQNDCKDDKCRIRIDYFVLFSRILPAHTDR